MKVVVVWTGESKDVVSRTVFPFFSRCQDSVAKITVTVITPSSTLTNEQAQIQFDEASRMLRRDGAKPRQTVFGVIMVTSLANFRSDLNIVRIPHGNYLDARDTLYVNINLLRLGSSGRTALTMESPGYASLGFSDTVWLIKPSLFLGRRYKNGSGSCILFPQ
jgi:hypothetical protein